MLTLIGAPGLETTSPAFRSELVSMANRIGLNPDALAVVISFETAGTFDPAQKNYAGSGATGLIQFMPSTAKVLGTTTAELATMSAEEQLSYVEAYYKKTGKLQQIGSPLDHYLAVFSPKYVGHPPATPMYSKGSKAYEQNAGLDADGDGVITVGDVGTKFMGLYKSSEANPRIAVYDGSDATTPMVASVGTVAALALTIYTLSRIRWHARNSG